MVSLTIWDVLLRLLVATLCGGVIGIDRGRKHRPAGFRTYILVCMGATLTVVLGAGTIIITGRQQVKGMTTAAGLWASACMGLAIGAGFYWAALISCFMIVLTMVFFTRLEGWMLVHSRHVNYYIEFEEIDDLSEISETIRSLNVRIYDVEISKAKNSEHNCPSAIFSLQLPKKMIHATLLTALAEINDVRSIEEL